MEIRRNLLCPQGWHTVKETAELLGVSTQSIYRYIGSGLLKAVKPRGMSRGYLVSDEALAELAEQFVPVG